LAHGFTLSGTLEEFLGNDARKNQFRLSFNIRGGLSYGQSALLLDCLRLEASKGRAVAQFNVIGARQAWMAGDLFLLLAQRRRNGKEMDSFSEFLRSVKGTQLVPGGEVIAVAPNPSWIRARAVKHGAQVSSAFMAACSRAGVRAMVPRDWQCDTACSGADEGSMTGRQAWDATHCVTAPGTTELGGTSFGAGLDSSLLGGSQGGDLGRVASMQCDVVHLPGEAEQVSGDVWRPAVDDSDGCVMVTGQSRVGGRLHTYTSAQDKNHPDFGSPFGGQDGEILGAWSGQSYAGKMHTEDVVGGEAVAGQGAALPATWDAPESHEVMPLGTALANTRGVDSLPGRRTSVAQIVAAIKKGESMAFFGRAGCGKSQFIREHLPAALQQKYGCEQWRACSMLTSSTGITALNVGGMTFHAAMGIGLGNLTVADTVTRMSAATRRRWTQAKITIVVDEIGFLSGEVFDKAYQVGTHVRASANLDMSGVQWLVFGDVLQLGAVPEWEVVNGIMARKSVPPYVFDSFAWGACCFSYVLLAGSFRQVGQAAFGDNNRSVCPSHSQKPH
jgi:hypothetical protein